jgi:hypothetical protein
MGRAVSGGRGGIEGSRRPMEAEIKETEGSAGGGGGQDGIDELAKLILGARLGEIEQLKGLVNDGAARREVLKGDLREVLVELFEGAEGRELGETLRPLVEGGLRASVERGGGGVDEALSPVLGAAIRRQLHPFTEHLALMMHEKIKATKGRWWLRARLRRQSEDELLWGAGSAYRVAEIGLFGRGELMPLCVVGSGGARWLLAAGSGQLGEEGKELREAALRFLAGRGGEEELTRPGAGCSFFCVEGVRTVLVARIEGTPGAEVRWRMAALAGWLDDIAREAGGAGELGSEGARGEEVRLILCEEGLIERPEEAAGRRRGALVWWVLLLVGLVGWLGVDHWRNEAARWDRFMAALGEQPGIEVLSDRRWREVVGLRDPRARDPWWVAWEHGYGEGELDWRFVVVPMGEWASLAVREAVLERGDGGREVEIDSFRAEVLKLVPDLPEDVELRVEDGILRARGGLEEPAFGRLVGQALELDGVEYIDATGLRDLTREKILELEDRLGAARVWFRAGVAELEEGAGEVLDEVVALLGQLDGEVEKKGQVYRLVPRVVVGGGGGEGIGREILGEGLGTFRRELDARWVEEVRLDEAVIEVDEELVPGRWGIWLGIDEG